MADADRGMVNQAGCSYVCLYIHIIWGTILNFVRNIAEDWAPSDSFHSFTLTSDFWLLADDT